MLKDLTLLRSERQKLSDWLNLDVTKLVLADLREMAVVARQGALRSPLSFALQKNGSLPDIGIINDLRSRFAGNAEGLLELERLLNQREQELIEILEDEKKNVSQQKPEDNLDRI
jgi:hypothetical protein